MAVFSTDQTLPVFLERNKEQDIELNLYVDGTLVTPTTATVSVFEPDGNAIVEDGNATEGQPSSYTITAATLPTTLTFSEDWVIEWTVTYGGETETIRQDCHLVLRVLHPVITHTTLSNLHFDISTKLKPTDRTNWQTEVDEAWDHIQARLVGTGKRPYLIMNPWSLRDVHLNLALSYVWREIATYTQGRGRYAEMADFYWKRYEAAWGALDFKYDYEQTGKGGDAADSVPGPPVVLLSGTNRDRFVPRRRGFYRRWGR